MKPHLEIALALPRLATMAASTHDQKEGQLNTISHVKHRPSPQRPRHRNTDSAQDHIQPSSAHCSRTWHCDCDQRSPINTLQYGKLVFTLHAAVIGNCTVQSANHTIIGQNTAHQFQPIFCDRQQRRSNITRR